MKVIFNSQSRWKKLLALQQLLIFTCVQTNTFNEQQVDLQTNMKLSIETQPSQNDEKKAANKLPPS